MDYDASNLLDPSRNPYGLEEHHHLHSRAFDADFEDGYRAQNSLDPRAPLGAQNGRSRPLLGVTGRGPARGMGMHHSYPADVWSQMREEEAMMAPPPVPEALASAQAQEGRAHTHRERAHKPDFKGMDMEQTAKLYAATSAAFTALQYDTPQPSTPLGARQPHADSPPVWNTLFGNHGPASDLVSSSDERPPNFLDTIKPRYLTPNAGLFQRSVAKLADNVASGGLGTSSVQTPPFGASPGPAPGDLVRRRAADLASWRYVGGPAYGEHARPFSPRYAQVHVSSPPPEADLGVPYAYPHDGVVRVLGSAPWGGDVSARSAYGEPARQTQPPSGTAFMATEMGPVMSASSFAVPAAAQTSPLWTRPQSQILSGTVLMATEMGPVPSASGFPVLFDERVPTASYVY